ncbi:Maltose acetyltransferase [Didymella heteroderae]|uniref:Maltose acetyltransferase n=1 Tax=Didymella heteroderae TaxID=1769908 RepID=A0A9P4WFQ1_9PLEO|nr:Maltose acetyltransferase [Didymella heteroderae]
MLTTRLTEIQQEHTTLLFGKMLEKPVGQRGTAERDLQLNDPRDFLATFLFVPARDQPLHTALTHFLAVPGINVDGDRATLRKAQHYSYMLAGMVYCRVCNKILPVHKTIMCIQSAYFEKAFQEDFVEGISGVLTFNDNSATAYWRIFEYLYTGDYSDDLSNDFDDDSALLRDPRVYALADMFFLDELKAISVSKLQQRLRNPRTCDMFSECIQEIFATTHDGDRAMRSCSPSAGLHAPQNLKPPAPSDEACPNDDHHATYSLPSTALAPAARPAPSSSHYAQPCLPPKSEKDRMLSGEPFLPDTAQLVGERDLCSQALFRFNTAEPGVSPYHGWFFERIVAAGWMYPRVGERQVTGHLGHGVNVSAPFHCDYGYNLSIGNDVVIGPSCQLLDSGRIAIGRNTKIGARVTISTMEEPTDARPIEGSERTMTTREVSIGENVYIGDGCIIKAGARIGDNAILRAG